MPHKGLHSISLHAHERKIRQIHLHFVEHNSIRYQIRLQSVLLQPPAVLVSPLPQKDAR